MSLITEITRGLDAISIRALPDQPPGVGWEEVIIIAEIKPLSVPLGMVGREPSGDVLLRLFYAARLLH